MPPPNSRLPHVWGDSHGTVGLVLNGPSGLAEPGEPMSPGTSPSTKHFIVKYEPYISLMEWELMKSNLKEEMPCRRDALRDYLPQPDIVSAPASGTASGSASECRGGAQRSPAQAVASARSSDTPKVNTISTEEHQAAALQSDSPTMVAGRMLVQPSPRAEAPRAPQAEALPSARESAPSPAPEPPSLLSKLLGGEPPSYDELPMKVSRVKANAVAGNGRQQPEKMRRVADRDKAHYGTGRQMKPAREMNLNSKKRLKELLKLPSMKIEAGDLHASRTYSVIPTQNLRVV